MPLEENHELIHYTARMRDAGRTCLKQAGMAMLYASDAAGKVCSYAIQTFGGYGYLKDFPAERYYRDARVARIYEGTNDIQSPVIARELQRQSPNVGESNDQSANR